MPSQRQLKQKYIYCDGHLYSQKTNPPKKVGSLRYDGYVRVSYKRSYYAHRLVWIYFHGTIAPKMQIDHINGNRADNRIENLRLVEHRENQMNMKRYSNNTSGESNIWWDKKKGRWRVSFKVKQKVRYYGYFVSLKNAVIKRDQIKLELGYHPNHGR